MADPLSTDAYKGVRDFYPTDWALLEALFTPIRKTLKLWGYEEYNASPLERAEVYETKTSEEIVHEQTYTFTDRGDRRVTLRPEMTPTLARMVAAKRREMPFPLRWFSIPNVFRYERPQRGRLREHYQLNVDLVGIASEEADIEVIRIAAELLQQFGAKDSDFMICLNDRRLLTAACKEAGLPAEKIPEYLRLLDKKSKMTPQEFSEALGTIAAVDPLQYLEQDVSGEVSAAKHKLLGMVEGLKALGIANVVFDPTITRGFDYYTGMVFEVFDTHAENTRSLFGGGRYDGLVSLFGGDPIPAVGFGMGDVTLADFLETHGLVPTVHTSPVVFLGTPPRNETTPTSSRASSQLADKLRDEGISVFVNLTDKSLGDQIKEAVRRGIPFFMAYGTDEVQSGKVRVKKLQTGEEILLPLSDLPTHLRSSNER